MSSKKKPKLGQNFLVDESACLRIADALGDIHDRTVVEIGPGHGAITNTLAQRCHRLHCVEFDPALARELNFRFRNDPHVTIHQTDILQTDFAAFLSSTEETVSTPPESDLSPLDSRIAHLESHTSNLDVIGNLPYYITSDILLHLFSAARAGAIRRAVLMMQREVADRIASPPGKSEYGALSAFTQMHASVATLFTLPPSAFSPPPEVFSSIVRLEFAPRFTELDVEPEGFNRFVRASFAQKRKTLQNNLRTVGFAASAIQSAWPPGLSAQARAETVSLEEMAALYRALLPSTDATEATKAGS